MPFFRNTKSWASSTLTHLMKILATRLFIVLHLLLVWLVRAEAQNNTQQPSKLQVAQINRGYGMFIHFGINTFNEAEWSAGDLPVSSYNPTALDCYQWVRVAKEAGFRYVILITKHHDGFCLWNSEHTDYDVAASPVKTDVVEAVSKACKKYGLEMGLYYSLWDRHEPLHNRPNPQEYVNFMKKQLTELLTHYGQVCELWFDGGWAKPDSSWHLPELYAHIKSLQPKCLVTVNHTITNPVTQKGIRQPKDMETGDPIRFWPVDFRTKDPNMARWDDPKLFTYDQKKYYLSFEHTICLSDRWNWFQKKAALPTRGIDELEELFYWCTSNNNTLIINAPPDQTGKLRPHEVNKLMELADRLEIRGGSKALPAGPINLTFNQPVVATSSVNGHDAKMANDASLETGWISASDTASLTIHFQKPILFDRISLFEQYEEKEMGDGFSILHAFAVQSYSLDVFEHERWVTVSMGETIGAARIIRLPSLQQADKIRIRILQASRPAGLFHVSVSDSRTKSLKKPSHEIRETPLSEGEF